MVMDLPTMRSFMGMLLAPIEALPPPRLAMPPKPPPSWRIGDASTCPSLLAISLHAAHTKYREYDCRRALRPDRARSTELPLPILNPKL